MPADAVPNNYETIYVGRAHGILGDFTAEVNAGVGNIFGYFLPSDGGAADIFRSIGEKFSPDGFSVDLSIRLASVDHPLNFVAYSEGTAVVANAALNGGLPAGSTFYFNSPIISRSAAMSAVNANVGHLGSYNLPPGDVANLISPGSHFISGFKDFFCGMCVHSSTKFQH